MEHARESAGMRRCSVVSAAGEIRQLATAPMEPAPKRHSHTLRRFPLFALFALR
jgi:hypothetical protein